MKKIAFVAAALAAALVVTGGTAEAAKKRARVVVTPPAPAYTWWNFWGVRDPRLDASNTVVGAGAAGAYYAIRHDRGHKFWSSGGGGTYVGTSAACAAVSPIVGTIVTQRELTQREVFISTANCFVPVVGGWAMNYWFDYYGWDQPKAPPRGRRG
ncbi:hypothetical protein [Pseudorhodoplanes sinuspersici]|uniref:Uncharacterized protein n=1 Tax=Pseudorhodoplanes sinuspersici TaxID=1235591 RepID=A0A1W6ZUG6_9HYPH|nr:hypothetical protein [Pseudorhodoplanes sinuspersici]ARQ00771.1 hypothetical protein CAK95_18025 [Pseudorhodoplanes sinuspersici]RKE72385.1 hypothetical protein DFP91_0250 [Pseudorhodoplanes sinuspersici]